MRKSLYPIAFAVIAVLSLGFLAKSTIFATGDSALRQRATISIDDLHKSINMKALLVDEVNEPF